MLVTTLLFVFWKLTRSYLDNSSPGVLSSCSVFTQLVRSALLSAYYQICLKIRKILKTWQWLNSQHSSMLMIDNAILTYLEFACCAVLCWFCFWREIKCFVYLETSSRDFCLALTCMLMLPAALMMTADSTAQPAPLTDSQDRKEGGGGRAGQSVSHI